MRKQIVLLVAAALVLTAGPFDVRAVAVQSDAVGTVRRVVHVLTLVGELLLERDLMVGGKGRGTIQQLLLLLVVVIAIGV